MKSLGLSHCALGIGAAVALLAGCGTPPFDFAQGDRPPIGAPGALLQGPASATHADRGGSWMLPAAKHASQLLYVADEQSNEVSVLELPNGKLLGELTG